jgi:hypothetical protein
MTKNTKNSPPPKSKEGNEPRKNNGNAAINAANNDERSPYWEHRWGLPTIPEHT